MINGWRYAQLNELIKSLNSGISVNSYDFQCSNNQKGILKTSCIYNGKFNVLENKAIIEEEYTRAKLNPMKNEIIISRMNTPQLVGEIGYVDKTYNNIYLPDRLWQTELKDGVCGKWLSLVLTTDRIKEQIKSIATGTSNSMKNISKPNFLAIVVPVPSFKEQEKMSEIFSTWDLAIEKQEQLIEKKKEFKKGLMQKLLSGEVRFKEFKDEWKIVKLGDVFKERKETGFGDLELLAITTANGVVRRTEVEVKDTSSEDKSKYKRILPGDIGYNTMRMWQGVSGLSKYEGIVSPAYTILRPVDNIDSLYMSYLFKVPKIINLFYRHSQGLVSDTLNLKYENFKDIKVCIPSIKEQRKITDIFVNCDKEIDLLQKELKTLKLQKKGLMQRLLTGEVRVKV